MRYFTLIAALVLCMAPEAAAQRDTTRADSAARADSIAREDSIRIVRELERIRGDARRPDTLPGPITTGGPTNPRLLPDLSVVGDLIADLSPDGSTQEDGRRFSIREIELAAQAAVDPYFRGDVFLGFSDVEGVSIEQAFLTATALPWGLEVRLGRYLMPVGKQNTTHRHDLHTIEYPYVIQNFLGPEGLKGTGVQASKILAPFGFYQELLLTAVDEFAGGEEVEVELVTDEPANKELSGLGYAARLRNYWDLSQSANLEISGSAITGKRAQPVLNPFDELAGVNARQSVVGVDVTFRWRPLQRGLYRSFSFQAEVMRQINEQDPELPPDAVEYAGPARDVTGAYAFARYQLSRRLYLGSRFDLLQSVDEDGEELTAISGYLQFFPSEFSKLMMGFERVMPAGGGEDINRLLLQATFALGPHKPHPF